VIPTCKVQTGPWIGGVYAEHALAQPVIRTGWGWVTLERGIEGSIYPEGGVVISVSLYESMRDVEDSYWGINLCDDFSRWHQHFAETFPYIGECVQIVESVKGHQTFAFSLQERFEKEGWVELLDWLQTGALDREIERFATAQNLSTAELQRYFDRVQYPAGEREAMRELGEKDSVAVVHASPPLEKQSDGGYRKLTQAEVAKTSLTIILEESGAEVGEYSVSEFLQGRPDLAPKLDAILVRVGFVDVPQ
jgi:hypothetical protein